jgi:hypothetical protein
MPVVHMDHENYDNRYIGEPVKNVNLSKFEIRAASSKGFEFSKGDSSLSGCRHPAPGETFPGTRP